MKVNNKKSFLIKKGINCHVIETNKFKTNLFSVFLTTPLSRDNVTKNALIAAVLRRGSQQMPSQEIINKKLENLYGASFNCGIEKIGDNSVFKFYLEVINDKFLYNHKENIISSGLEILFDIVFNPFIENESFKEEYLEGEKNNLKQIIEGKKDNKAVYATERCIEEMYKNKVYGLYKYGYVEDLQSISKENLYESYKKLIEECRIDIFASGEFETNIEKLINDKGIISQLNERDANYNRIDETRELNDEKVIKEKMDVSQGKLTIGLNIDKKMDNQFNIAMVFNGILGGGANSKLFQNVREKESLAYYANSKYIKRKNIILITCGIEISNYEKAVTVIKQQIADIRNGNFSDEDLSNSKKLIISIIKNIPEEQDTEVVYYYNKEMVNQNETIEEYQEKVKNVTKNQIIELAQGVSLDTIYFLN